MAIHGQTRDKVIAALTDRVPFRNSTGSFRGVNQKDGTGRLEGDTLAEFRAADVTYVVYSYGTPIAWVTRSGLVRIPGTRYSVTTSNHQGLARAYLT